MCVATAYQPMCRHSVYIISATKQTLAPASKSRKLRLREVKELIQGHPAGDWLQSQDSNAGLSGSKNRVLSSRPH